jgi:hypothetical protein
MATWPERAFDVVTEITKQVLTLSTAIITITITFWKNFASNATQDARDLFAWSWVCYAGSILFGIFTLMASAGNQAKKATPTINAGNIRVFGVLQLLAFFAGIVLTVIAGAEAI